MNDTPTREEFEKAVRDHFADLSKTLSSEEVDNYIASDEAQGEINSRYEDSVEEYEAGKITRNVFMVGCVSSVAYCLYMMY